MHVKFGLNIPNRLGIRKTQGGYFLTHTVILTVLLLTDFNILYQF